jgi:uncharacterized membrane protein YccC
MLTARQQEGLVQAAKMALAATVAWLVAKQIHAPQSFMAPYAAVFMMSETVYRSLAEAARLMATLVLGVLLAFVTITVIPNTAIALPVAVFTGAAIGRWHRFGDSGIWIGITALLMLTAGTADDAGYLVYRAVEAMIGAAVGLAVNVFVLPPLHLRDGRRAVEGVTTELDDLIRTIAGGLRDGWDDDAAQLWRRRARALENAVRRAEEAQSRSRESTRFNPRWVLHRRRHRPSGQDLGTRYEVTRQVQHMTEALVAAGDGTAPNAGPDFGPAFAELLDTLAAAVRDEGGDVTGALARSRRWRQALTDRGVVASNGERLDWSTQATLLLAAERAYSALLVN